MQAELRDALNSLGGRQRDGLHDGYIGYSAGHINRAIEGYIFLRESGRFDASKLLVRTALEAVIRVHAVRQKPELLFRIAFTEFEEDKKWVRPFNRPEIEDAIQAIDRQWQEFRQAYHAKYPEHPFTEKGLTLRRAAELAGIDGYYDSHYRLYCRFTHAAFRASTGDFNEFEAEDNRTMTLCAFATVDSLVAIGAAAPHLPTLKERMSSK
jgi:hypothetical protein